MFKYDVLLSSLGCILCACSPRRDLPSLFPDAERALGPFSIQLEKSRDTNVLSEAKVLVEQGTFGKHITLQLKMLQNQEQITLSFRPQSVPEDRLCAASPAEPAQPSVQTATFRDPSALFHIPLPLSVRDAKDTMVQGVGDDWAIRDGQLLWDPTRNPADAIDMSWTRNRVPETRYPLKTLEKPSHLKALRVDGDTETDIPVLWRSGSVWVSAQDIRAGSWLELRFDVPGTDQNFVLPQEPIAEGMKALVMLPGCLRENFLLEKSHLSWNCRTSQGPVWAASYTFHQSIGPMDFSDWPELSRLDPSSIQAVWDAGDELSVETYGSSLFPREVPEEARRVCMRASWTSGLAPESMPNADR